MRTRFVRISIIGPIAASLGIPMTAASASTTCSTVAACIFGIDTASGPGVEGTSSRGRGVQGVSTTGYGVVGFSATNDGVVGHTAMNSATPGTGKAGVSGYDDSTNHTPYNSGVYGVSNYAMGVQGRSTYGTAMLALSYNGNAITASAGTALYSGFTNTGVVAQSQTGDGIIGIGNTTGIVGFAANNCLGPTANVYCTTPLQNEIPSGAAVTAGTDSGGLGLSIVTDDNPNFNLFQNGVGATISSGTVGMMITPDRVSDGNPGLIVNGTMSPRDFSGGFQGAEISGFFGMSVTGYELGLAVSGETAIVAQGVGTGGSVLFQGSTGSGTTTSQLDDAGNLAIAGTLTTKGKITSTLQNSDGTYSAAYAARATIPTVEDMGEASLVSGAAFVPIDAAMRKSMNLAQGYLVFLTPQGATTGLYVTGKSNSGFAVREIGSARDSLAFDYRIVAQPYAERGQRLALVNTTIRSTLPSKALFYRHMKPLRFRHGELDRSSLPVPSM